MSGNTERQHVSSIKIVLDDLKDKFIETYMDDEVKQVIIINGGFGSGKTTFVKKTMEQSKDNYEYIYLTPIKYHAGNNDVFDLMKYDILCHFLSSGLIERIYDKSYKIKDWASIDAAVMDALFNIMELIGIKPDKINSMVKSTERVLSSVHKNVFKKGITVQDIFFESTEDSLNSVKTRLNYFDRPSIFIADIIRQFREKVEGKKIVLIIDDLDRLDPDQTFKTLNQMTVFLKDEFENPYQNLFDKVIFVCDMNNLKHAYHHKYGRETNFAGYFYKFHCGNIYDFDINGLYANAIKEDYIEFEGSSKNESTYFSGILDSGSFVRSCFVYLLETFLRHKIISVREMSFSKEMSFSFKGITNKILSGNQPIFITEIILALTSSYFQSLNDFTTQLKAIKYYLIDDENENNRELFILLSGYALIYKDEVKGNRSETCEVEAGGKKFILELETITRTVNFIKVIYPRSIDRNNFSIVEYKNFKELIIDKIIEKLEKL